LPSPCFEILLSLIAHQEAFIFQHHSFRSFIEF